MSTVGHTFRSSSDRRALESSTPSATSTHVGFPDVPEGLSITGLHAYDRRATAGGFVVITQQDKRENGLRPLPFKGLAFAPKSFYYTTVAVVAQRPGHYVIEHEDVVYRVGSTWYHQREDWVVDVTAS